MKMSTKWMVWMVIGNPPVPKMMLTEEVFDVAQPPPWAQGRGGRGRGRGHHTRVVRRSAEHRRSWGEDWREAGEEEAWTEVKKKKGGREEERREVVEGQKGAGRGGGRGRGGRREGEAPRPYRGSQSLQEGRRGGGRHHNTPSPRLSPEMFPPLANSPPPPHSSPPPPLSPLSPPTPATTLPSSLPPLSSPPPALPPASLLRTMEEIEAEMLVAPPMAPQAPPSPEEWARVAPLVSWVAGAWGEVARQLREGREGVTYYTGARGRGSSDL